MKTINKQSDYYVQRVKSAMEADGVDMSGRVAQICLRLVRESFIHGAEEMQEELTRWYDPKEETPEPNSWIMVKIGPLPNVGLEWEVKIARFDELAGWLHENMDAIDAKLILGWRPIHA